MTHNNSFTAHYARAPPAAQTVFWIPSPHSCSLLLLAWREYVHCAPFLAEADIYYSRLQPALVRAGVTPPAAGAPFEIAELRRMAFVMMREGLASNDGAAPTRAEMPCAIFLRRDGSVQIGQPPARFAARSSVGLTVQALGDNIPPHWSAFCSFSAASDEATPPNSPRARLSPPKAPRKRRRGDVDDN